MAPPASETIAHSVPNNRPALSHIAKAVALFAILAGCAPPDDQGYAHAVLDRPLPAAKDSTARECDFVNSEIARQKAMASAVPQKDLLPQTAAALQKATQTNIAALQTRATALGCPTASQAQQ
jgi:hypothetical protein